MIKTGVGTYVMEPFFDYGDPEVVIGAYCSIADHVTFCGGVNHAWLADNRLVSTYPFWRIYPSEAQRAFSRGPIRIGNDVWIGRGAFILDGVSVGDGAIIGAQAVVAGDVAPYAVVAGNPAKVLRYRFPPDQIERLVDIRWWDWPSEVLGARLADMQDVDSFVAKYGGPDA